MIFYNQQQATEKINHFSKEKIPFFFLISFDKQRNIVLSLDEVDTDSLQMSFNEMPEKCPLGVEFQKYPVGFEQYESYFEKVLSHIRRGDTYLINLTMPTPIDTNLSLEEIYRYSRAPYKLWLKEQLVCFSPEPFITIDNNTITTYPMKGTIDASLPNAENILLNDEKELAEHYTIVDLLRNDLSIVATDVRVEKFRYMELLKTIDKELWQTSSEITGTLLPEFRSNYGDLLMALLPAGSISGAPKKKTIDIIKETEDFDREFFTGVFGVYDGSRLQSAVMIRYIEQTHGKKIFYSGGGIVSHSEAHKEYQEMIDKVYLPIPSAIN
jgi:para-aminobenzoate synthetase component 1